MNGLKYFCWLTAIIFCCAFSTGSSIKDEKAAAITLGDLFRAGAPVFDSLQWTTCDSSVNFIPERLFNFDSAKNYDVFDPDTALTGKYRLFYSAGTLRKVQVRSERDTFDVHVFCRDSLVFYSVSGFYKNNSARKFRRSKRNSRQFRLNEKCMIVHFVKSDRTLYFGTENGILNSTPVFTSFLKLRCDFVPLTEIRFMPSVYPCTPQFLGRFMYTDLACVNETVFDTLPGNDTIGLETPVSKVFEYLDRELRPPYLHCKIENLDFICDPYWWIRSWTYECTGEESPE